MTILVAAVLLDKTCAEGPLKRNASEAIDKAVRRELANENHARYAYQEKATLTGKAPAPESQLAIWYREPASEYFWHVLPIGNGAIGGMVYGGVHTERIQFNEHSLWTGSDLYGDIGDYQPFGDLYVELGHLKADGYRRDLDMEDAVHRVGYTCEGTAYQREYFCSYPDKVMVLRFTADRPGAISGVVRMTDARRSRTVADTNRVTLVGALSNGMAYETQALVLNEGGKAAAERNTVRVDNADALTILLAAGTSFVPDHATGWLGNHPHHKVTETINAASAKPYEVLKTAHVADYQSLFGRVRLDLGKTDPSRTELTVGERIKGYGQSVVV